MSMLRPLAALALFLALTLAACGGDDDATPSAIPSGTPTGSPQPTASPSPASASVQQILAASGGKIVYIRGIGSDAPMAGRIWLATDDARLAAPVTPEGAEAIYAGLHRSGTDALLYYATIDGGKARTLWEADLLSGESRRVLSFASRHEFDAYASVSPDGRRVAYTDSDSLRLLDMASGEDRLLLQGNGAACDLPAVGGCFVYTTAQWSPNGKLLLVEKVYYEGGRPVIVDPFAAEPNETPAEGMPRGVNESVGPRAWSPGSESFCGVNSYDGTGLFLGSAPGWQLVDLVPEYELPTGPPGSPQRYIRSCDWLSTDAIAFATVVAEYDSPLTRSAPSIFSIEVSVHRLATSETETVATIESDQVLQSPALFALSAGTVLLGYFAGPITTGKTTPAQPGIVDLETGDFSPLLREGDWVVAVISP